MRFDRDWFAFSATAGTVYTIGTSLGSLNDSILRLLGPDGRTELAFNDDFGVNLGSQISWRAPASATYYAEVTGYDESLGDYQLTITESTIVGDDHGDAAETATPMAFPCDMTGRINQADDID